MTPDPFTRLERALWAMINSTPEITAIVRPANRVHTTDGPEVPGRVNVTAGDLPQLRIVPAGGDFNRAGGGVSSSSIVIEQVYEFQITTDELRTGGLDRAVNACKWGVFVGLSRWFNGKAPAGFQGFRVAASPFSDANSANAQPANGVPGWRMVTAITFSMAFNRNEVI